MRKNRPHVPSRFDPDAATALAQKLREEGLSLSQIGARLRKAKLTPQRGGKWFPAQVAKLLESPADRKSAARRASELRTQGMTLKEIGVRLVMEGFHRDGGGAWYPSLVVGLLRSVQEVSEENEHQTEGLDVQ